MSLKRWKVAACTLTLGVGGLAVFAADKKDTPKPAPPALLPTITAPGGDDTPSGPATIAPPPLPAKNTAQAVEIEIELPSIPKKPNVVGLQTPDIPTPDLDIPVRAYGKAVPPLAIGNGWMDKAKTFAEQAAKAPVFVPVDVPPLPIGLTPPPLPNDIVPVKGEAEFDLKPPAPKTDAIKKDDKKPANPVPPPPVPDLDIELPSSPKVPVTPPAPPAVTPDAKKPVDRPVPAPFTDTPPKVLADTLPPPPMNLLPPTSPPGAPPLAPLPPKVEVTPAPFVETKPAPAARLKMTLRMGDGKPRFEIRNTASEELLLKVSGEKVEMTTPPDGRPSTLAGVSAVGHVKFTAPGIEGSCDHLTILSGTGEVLMKGNIRLKTKRGKAWSEMTAEKLVYQIAATGLNAPTTPRPLVTPASYIPD